MLLTIPRYASTIIVSSVLAGSSREYACAIHDADGVNAKKTSEHGVTVAPVAFALYTNGKE